MSPFQLCGRRSGDCHLIVLVAYMTLVQFLFFSVTLRLSFFMCTLIVPEHTGGIPMSWATQLDILYSHSLLWLAVLRHPAAVTLWMGHFIQYEVRLSLPPSAVTYHRPGCHSGPHRVVHST
jgi:hypothetical protein